jgi:hypothetical protein
MTDGLADNASRNVTLSLAHLISISRLVKLGPTVVSETSSVKLPRTPSKNPKTKINIHSKMKV